MYLVKSVSFFLYKQQDHALVQVSKIFAGPDRIRLLYIYSKNLCQELLLRHYLNLTVAYSVIHKKKQYEINYLFD